MLVLSFDIFCRLRVFMLLSPRVLFSDQIHFVSLLMQRQNPKDVSYTQLTLQSQIFYNPPLSIDAYRIQFIDA